VEDGTVSAALNEFVDRKRLAAALQAEDVVIREGAVRVAGKLRDKAFITLLVDALADQHVNVRYRAAEALGRIKHPAAVEPLIRALNDTSQPVRARAAETLGELEDPKAAGPLIQVIKKKGENHHVADFASTALVKIGGPAVPSLIEHLGNQGGSQSVRIGSTIWPIKAAFAQALGRIGLPAVEPLVKALKSNDPKVRNGAALALAILWDTSEYIQSHKSILHDEDYLVRGRDCQVFKRTDMWLPTEKTKPLPMIAVIWLESWGLPRSRPHPKVPTESTVMAALIVALQDEYPTRDEPEKYERYVRVWAAEALGLIGDARAVDPLRAALGDPVPEVVRIAANALGKIQDPRAVDALIQALKNPRARNSAAWNLGKVGDSRAVEPLVEAMKDQDQEFRKWAAEALAKITSRAAAPR
jgi:HEAT repeat protein